MEIFFHPAFVILVIIFGPLVCAKTYRTCSRCSKVNRRLMELVSEDTPLDVFYNELARMEIYKKNWFSLTKMRSGLFFGLVRRKTMAHIVARLIRNNGEEETKTICEAIVSHFATVEPTVFQYRHKKFVENHVDDIRSRVLKIIDKYKENVRWHVFSFEINEAIRVLFESFDTADQEDDEATQTNFMEDTRTMLANYRKPIIATPKVALQKLKAKWPKKPAVASTPAAANSMSN